MWKAWRPPIGRGRLQPLNRVQRTVKIREWQRIGYGYEDICFMLGISKRSIKTANEVKRFYFRERENDEQSA